MSTNQRDELPREFATRRGTYVVRTDGMPDGYVPPSASLDPPDQHISHDTQRDGLRERIMKALAKWLHRGPSLNDLADAVLTEVRNEDESHYVDDMGRHVCDLALRAETKLTAVLTDVRTVLDQLHPHCHRMPGRWDSDGSECVECAARERLKTAVEATDG